MNHWYSTHNINYGTEATCLWEIKNKPAINKQTRPIETIKSKSAADNDDDYDRPIKRKTKDIKLCPMSKEEN